MDSLLIVTDVNSISKEKIHRRRHFSNVFDHLNRLRAVATVEDSTPNQYVPTSLKREDLIDHVVEIEAHVEAKQVSDRERQPFLFSVFLNSP
jgi:hypothetical protein